MTNKPRLIILDTDVVIDLHKLGLWDKIVNIYDVRLSSIVARKEVQYFTQEVGGIAHKKHVNLETDDRVTVIDLTASQLADFLNRLEPQDILSFDDGERETLAAVHAQITEGLTAVLIDEFAIKCAVFGGISSDCMSFETMLSNEGIAKPLPYRLSDKRYKRIVSKANVEKICRQST